MADVARGSVLLTPKFDNLTGSITEQLNGAFSGASAIGSKAGAQTGTNFSSSLGAKAGAVAGIVSSITKGAFNAISNSLGSAINRVDTMANFPKVMKNLGYSSQEATAAIKKMSKAVDGLPTSLPGLSSMVQQLAPLCDSLDEATNIGIAFNDMCLASGASTADVSRAMQQYSQILSKGKPELQDWKTLQEVMPGQLNQVAKALLGTTANSKDLYNALKDGSITMDDFNNAVMKLDTEGVDGFASFAQQAKDATQGIGTAVDNVMNRIAKAVAKVIDAIGQANISKLINDFSKSFDVAANAAVTAIDYLKDHADTITTTLRGIAPAASAAAGGIMALKAALAVESAMSSFQKGLQGVKRGIATVRLALAISGGFNGTFFSALAGTVKDSVSWLKVATVAAGALLGGFVALYNLSPGFASGVNAIGDAVKSGLSGAFTSAGGAIQTIGDRLGGFLQSAAPAIQSFVSGAATAISGFVSKIGPALSGAVSNIVSLFTKIGSSIAPVLSGAFDALASFGSGFASAFAPAVTQALDTLVPALQQSGKIISDSFAQIGPALSQAAATLGPAFGQIGATLAKTGAQIASSLAPALASVMDVMPQLASAFTDVITAVSSLYAALAPVIAQLVSTLVPVIARVVSSIAPLIAQLIGQLAPVLAQIIAVIAQVVAAVAPVIAMIAAQLLPVIAQVVGMVLNVVAQIVATVLPIFAQIIAAIAPLITTLISILVPVIQTILSIVQFAIPIIGTIFSTTFSIISNIVSVAMSVVQVVISTVMGVISAIINTVLAAIHGDWSGVWEGIKSIASTVWNGIKNIVSTVINSVSSIISSVLDSIKSTWDSIWSSVSSFLSETWEGIKSAASDGVDAVYNTVTGIKDSIIGFFSGAGEWLVESGKALLNGFADGITGALSGVTDTVSGALSTLRGLFPFSPAKYGPFSGHGWVLYSGISIAEALGEGFARAVPGAVGDFEAGMSRLSGVTSMAAPDITASPRAVAAGPSYTFYIDGAQVADDERLASALMAVAERVKARKGMR